MGCLQLHFRPCISEVFSKFPKWDFLKTPGTSILRSFSAVSSMGYCCSYLLFGLSLCFLLITDTHELQSSQAKVLKQLRKHLEFPKPLDIWDDYTGDLCYSPTSSQISIVCEENMVAELKIMGNMPAQVRKFEGFPIPNQTLSNSFSIDSFVTTLSRLSSLRVLSLVSLGMWGPLPDKIHRLYLLEYLDLSSNYLYGSMPAKISSMVKLQVLTLDDNFFNGSVPDWFDSLSSLTILSLKNNQLNGPFPSSLGRITTLTDLALSNNAISRKLPSLGGLSSLHVLDLRDNQIDSELPIMPKGLVNALFSNNSISGEIPQQFGELSQLQHLDMSFNSLQGSPLPALFSLPNISYLNLASNMLAGSLANQIKCSNELGFVDISNNLLTGGLPSCLNSASRKRLVKFGGNCLSAKFGHQHEASYCEKKLEQSARHSAVGLSSSIGVLVAVIGGLTVFLSFLVFGCLILCRKCCLRRASKQNLLPKAAQENSMTGFSSEILANARYISEASKLGTQGVPAYRVFFIEEIKEATNNFDQSTFLGEGSIGKIYKGRLENGTYVAIRCLALFKRYSIRNLKLRLDMLSKLRHPNLVCLLGHCIDGGERDDSNVNRVFLVYEYVPNGNLNTYLSEDNPEKVLKWSERLTVLIGIAKAVHFLHNGMIPGFFNNQLKTNNILLDENRVAKLSDYGLSIITNEIEKLGVKKEGYKSSEPKKLEDDVYSFGFILLEMLVGPSTAAKGEAFLLNEMTLFGTQDKQRRIVDPTVLSTCSEESLSIIISITNKCISTETSSHPSFEDVLWNLHYAAQVQANAEGDQRSDASLQP